jgi:hypothetical protein
VSKLVSEKRNVQARCQRLMPVILATQEAEIKRIMVRSQPKQIVHKPLSQKILNTKQGWLSGSSGRAPA